MKNTVLIFLVLIAISTSISSCIEPRKALEKGNYQQAFNLANRKIKMQKDIEDNTEVLKLSADKMVENELRSNQNLILTNKTKNLVKAQNSYYQLLCKMGKVNISTGGLISNEYDVLCTEKKELDYKIADNFYQAGYDYLDKFYGDWQKVEARRAYSKFKDCRKYEGDLFFKNITDLLNESIKRGTVYYIGHNYRNSLFFKRLPKNSEEEPDCDIDIQYGRIHFDEDKESTSKVYNKEIKTGTKTETDTSGRVTIIPIYEKITATVTTTVITVTASSYTDISVINLSGQCSISNRRFESHVSDSYEIVEISGDSRATTKSFSREAPISEFWLKTELNNLIQFRL